MGVAHALNSIALQAIAHGVGSYSNKNKRMAAARAANQVLWRCTMSKPRSN